MRPANFGKSKGAAWIMVHVGYRGDDCLRWPFCIDKRVGRGMLGYKGKLYWAHRLMCEMAHGKPSTPKLQARHSCGNGHKRCCNPRHLSWGTNSQNQKDRRKHGTHVGNRWGNQGRMTPRDVNRVRTLRRKGKTQVAIAKIMGVSLGCIQYWLGVREQRMAA